MVTCGDIILWSPQLPDFSPIDLSVCGFINNQAYSSQVPKPIPKQKSQISTALGLIDLNNMLANIRQDLIYRWDSCRIIKDNNNSNHLWKKIIIVCFAMLMYILLSVCITMHNISLVLPNWFIPTLQFITLFRLLFRWLKIGIKTI